MWNRAPSLVGLILVAPVTGLAQTPPPVTPLLCWEAKPLPQCRTWVVSEIGFEASIVTTHTRVEDFGHAVAITFGRMKNTSPTRAWGFTGTVYSSAEQPGLRAEARRLTWTSQRTSREWSAGLISQPTGPGSSEWGLGLTAAHALTAEWMALGGRANLMYGERGAAAGLSGGVRAGGKLGGAAAVLFAVGVLVLIIQLSNAGEL